MQQSKKQYLKANYKEVKEAIIDMQKRFESELEKRVLKIFEYLGYEFDNKIWVNDEKDISQLLYVPEYEILHTLQEGITNKIDGNTDNVKKSTNNRFSKHSK